VRKKKEEEEEETIAKYNGLPYWAAIMNTCMLTMKQDKTIVQ